MSKPKCSYNTSVVTVMETRIITSSFLLAPEDFVDERVVPANDRKWFNNLSLRRKNVWRGIRRMKHKAHVAAINEIALAEDGIILDKING